MDANAELYDNLHFERQSCRRKGRTEETVELNQWIVVVESDKSAKGGEHGAGAEMGEDVYEGTNLWQANGWAGLG